MGGFDLGVEKVGKDNDCGGDFCDFRYGEPLGYFLILLLSLGGEETRRHISRVSSKDFY